MGWPGDTDVAVVAIERRERTEATTAGGDVCLDDTKLGLLLSAAADGW